MQEIGALDTYQPQALAMYFGEALANPYVILGTALNALFYFLMLAVLSWADVTVALPLTAIEYGFAAMLAITILHEVVPPLRWAGIALVIVGVVMISLSGGAHS
jgi:drug/metabolite transporter (DMT)-like permease